MCVCVCVRAARASGAADVFNDDRLRAALLCVGCEWGGELDALAWHASSRQRRFDRCLTEHAV